METLFEGLTSSEIDYLKYLQERGYYDGIEMFIKLDSSSDYRVEKLIKGNYISTDESSNGGKVNVQITGKGVAALIDFDKYLNQIQPLKEQIRVLENIAESQKSQAKDAASIAESAKKQAELAISESESAKKGSRFATFISVIATLVSIATIVIPLIFG